MLPEQAIRSADEAKNIPDLRARMIAERAFTHLHPDREVTVEYEPEVYSIVHHGKKATTVPDLRIVPKGLPKYIIETTESDPKPYYKAPFLPIWINNTAAYRDADGVIDSLPLVGICDPKGRQKRIMSLALPDIEYKVVYGRDFREMFADIEENLLPTAFYRQRRLPFTEKLKVSKNRFGIKTYWGEWVPRPKPSETFQQLTLWPSQHSQ